MHRGTLVFAVLALAVVSCTGGVEETTEVLESPTVTPTTSVSVASSPSASTSPDEPGIDVQAPRPDDDILSPVVVRGTGTAASGEVLVRVLAADGMELAAMNASIDCGSSCGGSFRAVLAFFVPSRQAGAVQVFEVGPAGSAEHLVEIAVTLVPGV